MKKIKKNTISSSITYNTELEDDISLINTLQTLPVGVLIYSLNKILFINNTALKILNFNKKEEKKIYSNSIFNFLLPEEHKIVKQNIKKLFSNKHLDTKTYLVKNFKNECFNLDVKSNVISFKGAKVIQSVFSNVTDLILKEEKFKLITQNANDIIYFYSYFPEPKYIYISPSIKKVLGYSESDFYNNPNLCHSLVTDLKEYIKFEKKLLKEQKNNTFKPTTVVFQYNTKSGNSIWLEDNYSPVYDNNGKIKFILGISRDITKEKESQFELEKKWHNYKNLLDTSPIGIFIHDGYCIYCNKTAADILEVSDPKKLVGKYLMDFVVPEQRQQGIERIKRAAKGEELSDLAYKVKTVKGNIIDVELKTVPFIYNGKQVVQTIVSNISAEKQLSKEKIRAEIAEESNKKLKDEINYRKKIESELLFQTKKYDAIFNSTSYLIWTINKEFKITSFNKNCFDYLNLSYNHKIKIGQTIKSIFKNKPKEVKYWIDLYKRVFSSKIEDKVDFYEVKSQNINGKIYYIEAFLHAIRDKNNNVNEIAIIARNVTERRLSEQKIIDQSLKLKAIFESGNHLIWTLNKNFELTSYNANYFNLIETKKINSKLLNGKSILIIDTIKDKEKFKFWINKYKYAFKGNTDVFVHKSIINNKEIYREFYLYPIWLNDEVVEVSVMAQDITDRIEKENKIREQAGKLRAIFESGNQLIWTNTPDLILTSFNQNYADSIYNNFGYYPVVGQSLRNEKTTAYHDFWDEKYKLVLSGNQVEFILDSINNNGQKLVRQIILFPIKDINGNVIEISGIGFDITQNKINEEQITQSLREKEVLLKEIHHRVKNNMQVISSILNLQSSYVKDAYALNLLKECQNRIKSMAFIHESLYQNKNFASVNFSEYITSLANNLIHSYSLNSTNIKLNLHLENLMLNLDTSIPCGLIINEIISNSLKYAFPNNRDGIIFVNLKSINNIVKLEIGDNGIGLPEHVNLKNTQTLGLQLVDTLVEQLYGTINFSRNNGTIFSIEFNI